MERLIPEMQTGFRDQEEATSAPGAGWSQGPQEATVPEGCSPREWALQQKRRPLPPSPSPTPAAGLPAAEAPGTEAWITQVGRGCVGEGADQITVTVSPSVQFGL